MTKSTGNLDELRQQIDLIDDQMADLLAQRLEVVAAIGALKRRDQGGGLALRPAREVDIVRRLVRRTEGRFPGSTLVRIWRELLSETTRLQSRLVPALVRGNDDADHTKTVFDHFGSRAAILMTERAVGAVEAIMKGDADIAVVPVVSPLSEDWLDFVGAMTEGSEARPRIIGRLPLWVPIGWQGRELWTIARLPDERSSDDRAVFAVELDARISRPALIAHLRASGLDPLWLTDAAEPGGRLIHGLDVRGFVGDVADRMQELCAQLGDGSAVARPLGGYADPLFERSENPAV